MANSSLLSFLGVTTSCLLLLLLLGCSPQLTAAQQNSIQLPDLSKKMDEGMGKIGSMFNTAAGGAMNIVEKYIACSTKPEIRNCMSHLEGVKMDESKAFVPAEGGFTQAGCCSMKKVGRCMSEKAEAECKDLASTVASAADKQFESNCAAYKDVCSAGGSLGANSTTTLAALALLFLLTAFTTRLVSV